MADKTYSVLLQIKSDVSGLKEATQAINKAKDQVNIFKDTFTGGLFNIGAGIGNAIKRGLSQIPKTIAACIDGFAEQEQATRTLEAALKSSGQEVEGNVKAFSALASEIQSCTTEGDEAVLGMASVATAMGVQAEQMDMVIKGAVGLSRAFKMDLQTATKASAAAIQGKTDLLTRYIPMLSECQSEEEKLAEVMRAQHTGYAMAQAETRSYSGAVAQMQNALGDVGEVIGSAIAHLARDFTQKSPRGKRGLF